MTTGRASYVRKRLLPDDLDNMRINLPVQKRKLSAEPVCDFCGSSDPVFIYAATKSDTDRRLWWRWCACDLCAEAVENIGFRDPQQPASRLKGAVVSNTVEREKSSQFLNNRDTRDKIVGIWNETIAGYLLSRGLVQKDKNRFYFPPDEGNKAREIQWSAPRRTATRKVA